MAKREIRHVLESVWPLVRAGIFDAGMLSTSSQT